MQNYLLRNFLVNFYRYTIRKIYERFVFLIILRFGIFILRPKNCNFFLNLLTRIYLQGLRKIKNSFAHSKNQKRFCSFLILIFFKQLFLIFLTMKHQNFSPKSPKN